MTAPKAVKHIRVPVTQSQDDTITREAKARGISKAQLLLDCAAEAIDDLDPKRREVGQRDFETARNQPRTAGQHLRELQRSDDRPEPTEPGPIQIDIDRW